MSNKSKNVPETIQDDSEVINEMINLHMSYLKTVRFPLIASYFAEKGINISLQEIRDIFPEGEVINTPVKKSVSVNTCKRIMDEKSKKAGEECGNSSWKTALICKRCMDLKCGRDLATKLANQLDLDFEVVTGGYDFPKATDAKPASARGRGATRGRGTATRGPARGRSTRVNVVKKINGYKDGQSEEESSEEEKKAETSEDEDQVDNSEASDEEEVAQPVAPKRRISKVNK